MFGRAHTSSCPQSLALCLSDLALVTLVLFIESAFMLGSAVAHTVTLLPDSYGRQVSMHTKAWGIHAKHLDCHRV